ncbi:MAG: Clp protease ClpP, partial [Gammaproteobacteria bacterium]|nr:Clp protease ClpP [Gammaproteobacteria bacterium]
MKTQLFNHMKTRYERFKKQRMAFDPGATTWYSIQAKDKGPADVYIYDAIGFFGIEAEAFVKDFDAIKADKINLRINSPGGDVFDGMAIFNAIKRHPAKVTTEIDGVAASMASLIALAGDTVNMSELGLFMIHEPFSLVLGTADDMRSEADLLDKIADQGVSIYQASSNLTEMEIMAAMSAETWYTAEEAYDAGFIHNIVENESKKEQIYDLSMFDNPPVDRCVPATERDVE